MTTKSEGERRARRLVGALRAVVALALAVAIAAAALQPGVRSALLESWQLLMAGDLPGLRAWGHALGPWAPLATTALMIAQALAAPVPAVVVTFTNSWLFGPFWGGLLSIAQGTLAAVICFALTRALGAPLVRRLVSEGTLARANALVERHGAATVLIGRLVPIVPFDPLSYAAGLTRMRLLPFTAATFAGQVPAGMAYAYLAQEADDPRRAVAWIAGLALGLLALAAALRRRRRTGDAPDPPP